MRALTVLLLLATGAAGQARLSDLDGMAGCWERRDEKKQMFFSEQWMKPAGGAMLGMGRTVANGKAVDWEFMRIQQRGDSLVFVARPRENKEETEFPLLSAKPGEVVFENKEHDFPQRVIYRFSGDAMTGRVEGQMNGRSRSLDFPFKKVPCG